MNTLATYLVLFVLMVVANVLGHALDFIIQNEREMVVQQIGPMDERVLPPRSRGKGSF